MLMKVAPISELFQAMRMLCLIESSQSSEKQDGDGDAAYLAQLAELKAHQQVLRSLRALRATADEAELREFEAVYVGQLSAIYHDPKAVLEETAEGPGWFLVNPTAAAKIRPQLIANLAWLFASQAARLDSRALRSIRSSPPTAAGACAVVSQLCADLGAWLVRQPSVGEESLTDWLLYQLTERAAWIKYQKFTRHEESVQTGADWEWWFVGDQRCIGIRVQAKKLLGHSDVYPHLAYANRRGLQIEMLLDSARQYNMLPFYALYHAMPTMPPVKCKASTHAGAHGIFLADAVEVYEKWVKVGRQRIVPERLLADSNPLTCMFCCAAAMSRTDAPCFETVHDFIFEHYPVATHATQENSDVLPGIHERVPAHVQALLQSPDGEQPAWIESEFKQRLQDVDSLLVFDLRGEKKA